MNISKRKLLMVGGGYADIPLIKAAQDLGFYVITTGNRPEELGHVESDQYCQADFSNPDEILSLARKLDIDAVCPCCNDFSAIASAYVAENMGLPGHDSFEVSQLLHHKDRYRKFASDNSIPSPQAEGFSSVDSAMAAIDKFQLPVIVKPVDLTGGKGITKVSCVDDIREALESAFSTSKYKRIVVEEFVEGSRHGLSTFIRDGKVAFSFADNEHYYLNPYLVYAASTPSNSFSESIKELHAVTEKIVNLLGLKTGIFHIQYILNEKGRPIIIEICRRAPGDLYIKFVEYATGVDYSSYIVRAAAGLDCSQLSMVEPKGFFSRNCLMSAENGYLEEIAISTSISSNIIEEFLWWNVGDQIKNHMVYKAGILFLQYDSMEEMLAKTEDLHQYVRFYFQ